MIWASDSRQRFRRWDPRLEARNVRDGGNDGTVHDKRRTLCAIPGRAVQGA